jgi:hypothetical protein
MKHRFPVRQPIGFATLREGPTEHCMFEHKGGVVPGVLARPKPRRRHTTACQPLRKPRSLAYSHGMRTHKTKLALWAGLVLTAQIAHAQVTVLEDSRNYRLTTTVTGYPESPTKKVSGTNASFSVSAEITPITNNSGLLKWNRDQELVSGPRR